MQIQSKEIQSKTRYFYFEDECHLVWGDACGYTWSHRNSRLLLPVANERARQTYFGVLDILSGTVLIRPYARANSQTMIAFLKYLLKSHPGKNITVCLDKATYHRSVLVKNFVRNINAGLSKDNQRLKLIFLANDAPEENPIEDVWLYGKTAIRKDPTNLDSFQDVRDRFERSLRHKKFKNKKLMRYKKVLQLI